MIEQESLYDYGAVPDGNGLPGLPARITAQHKERYEIVCPRGRAFARLKAGAYYGSGALFPTVGDYVMVKEVENGDALILSTLPRSSCFSRRAPGPVPREQAIAANFDYVFILQSMNRNFNLRRLERYLALAWQSGATPVVVLTKADLTEDRAAFLAQAESAAPGVPVHAVSARTGEGMAALAPYLQQGKTLVFLGSSGVGKSSLVNALAGEEIMDVSGIRESDGRGRHTTTHRELVMLSCGAMVIDTPGMRELGMWDVSEGLGQAFSDIEKYAQMCRFRDCRHENEPGCAVRAAIESGELDESRLESYRKLKSEAKYSDDKESYRRQKEQWAKSVSVYSRKLKKEGKMKR